MICISNGLLPDLKAQELENKEKRKKSIVADFSYDNTIEETDDAIRVFQKNFSSKKGKLSIVAYSVLSAAAIAAIVLNPKMYVLYLALAFCALGLYYSITDKSRMRKKVLETLKKMDPEDYHCTIFDDKIEIETIIKKKYDDTQTDASDNNGENAGEADVNDNDEPIKSVFRFGTDMLDFAESDTSLLLVLARRQIYCFPKRCLTEEQQKIIRDFLTKKLSEYNGF